MATNSDPSSDCPLLKSKCTWLPGRERWTVVGQYIVDTGKIILVDSKFKLEKLKSSIQLSN